jgi:c-di-GMP-binding flagellar brake protein YcgR
MDDRRRIPRVPVFFVVERVSLDNRPAPELQGVVKNITPEGLLLETNVPLHRNDLLQMSFTLPHVQKALNLEARVCWTEAKKAWSTAGLEFMNLEAEQREAIMEYLMGLGPNLEF